MLAQPLARMGRADQRHPDREADRGDAEDPLPPFRPLPGLALTGLIAAAAFAIHHIPGFGALSPLILAITLGMALHNIVGTPASARDGVRFSLRRLLRAGIVLLGLQLTLGQIEQVGVAAVAVGGWATLLSGLVVAASLEAGELVRVPFRAARRSFRLLRHPDRHRTAAASAFAALAADPAA